VNAMCRYHSYHKCSCHKCVKSYRKEAHAHCGKACQSKAKKHDYYDNQKTTCQSSKPWVKEQYCDEKPIYHKKKSRTNKCNCHYCQKHKQRKEYLCHCYEK